MFRRKHADTTGEQLIPFDLWGSNGWCNQEVVGESHYLRALQRLLPRDKSERKEVETTALLVAEPTNPHDRNAVAVQIDGATVGYLPREIAARYQPVCVHLRDQGRVARVRCRIWGGSFTDIDYDRNDRLVEKERFNASVTVALADAHLCLPVNQQPSQPHVLLPDGASIQVKDEEQHMPAITPHLRPEGECYAYVTLHEVAEATARGAKELVEVRLDGQPVGRLTPKMSGDLLPAIRLLDRMTHLTAAKAKIRGNRLRAEVTLHCSRTHELPADWPPELAGQAGRVTSSDEAPVATVTVHEPIPAKPTRISFAVPPAWPPAPDGWEPPADWKPDPMWPPAPAGWRFWIAE